MVNSGSSAVLLTQNFLSPFMMHDSCQSDFLAFIACGYAQHQLCIANYCFLNIASIQAFAQIMPNVTRYKYYLYAVILWVFQMKKYSSSFGDYKNIQKL
jgi:hypothetical protein